MTGCRISEALAIRAGDVDLEAGGIRIATLKRRRAHWRAVPVAAVLGHASLTTTAIYTTAIGAPARELVSRVWG